MSTLTDQIETQLQLHRQAALIKNQAQGIWYTGGDLLEDIALCRTSLQQQSVGAGQQLLISLDNTAVLPVLLIASWKLGINVTLAAPTKQRPSLPPDHFTAMVYPPNQMHILAAQVDPQQVSLLTLLLNTAPNFAYFVQDLAPALVQTPEAGLQLPGEPQVWSQAALLKALQTLPTNTPITDIYDLEHGILPLLANLLQPTPFALACAG
jgi:hypothetical protein